MMVNSWRFNKEVKYKRERRLRKSKNKRGGWGVLKDTLKLKEENRVGIGYKNVNVYEGDEGDSESTETHFVQKYYKYMQLLVYN